MKLIPKLTKCLSQKMKPYEASDISEAINQAFDNKQEN